MTNNNTREYDGIGFSDIPEVHALEKTRDRAQINTLAADMVEFGNEKKLVKYRKHLCRKSGAGA